MTEYCRCLIRDYEGNYGEYLLGFNKEKEQVLVYDNRDELLILPFRLFEVYNRWQKTKDTLNQIDD